MDAHTTDWLDQYKKLDKDIITDKFLLNTLDERYDKVIDYIDDPKSFTKAMLGENNEIQYSKNISIKTNGKNTLKSIINENKGKVVFIDIWAVWCSPCVSSLSYANQLVNQYKGKDVEFEFINVLSKKEEWMKKLEELKTGGNHLYLDAATSWDIMKMFNTEGVPYFVLIDKEGNIVDYGLHLHPKGDLLKSQIDKFIAK